jgi:ATP-dependent DNA helicase RecG
MILSALRAERRCDIHRLAKLSMHSESRCKSAVERLVESGLVEAVGSNRTRIYILSSKVYREGKKSIEYVSQSGIDSVKNPEMVLKLVKEQGSIQREDVCKLLSISRPQAYRLLKSLTAQGLLMLSGHGRGAEYVSSRK